MSEKKYSWTPPPWVDEVIRFLRSSEPAPDPGVLGTMEPTENFPEVVYDYSFSVWPEEKRGFQHQTYELFKFLQGRVEMTFTESGFRNFRSALAVDGLTRREVSRILHHEPEPVS